MPKATWNRILEDLTRLQIEDQQNPPPPGQPNKSDQYRRQKIAAVEQITKRPLIIYASACTSPGKAIPPEMLMLDFSDKIGFKTVTDSVDAPTLDVLLHSPGGYAEAAESIVQQIRAKYSDIRFIIPSFAKSAATMLVMSGNEILMDRDAKLGNTQKITLTGNVTSSTLANAAAGEQIHFLICQDGTGSRTFVWPSNVKGGMTIGSTASKCSAQNFIFDGTNAYALSAGAANL